MSPAAMERLESGAGNNSLVLTQLSHFHCRGCSPARKATEAELYDERKKMRGSRITEVIRQLQEEVEKKKPSGHLAPTTAGHEEG